MSASLTATRDDAFPAAPSMTRKPDDRSSSTSSATPGSAAQARPAIEFKGLSHPTIRAVVNDASTRAVRESLLDLLSEEDGGFEWQPAVIDVATLAAGASPDLAELCAILRSLKLHPVAVAGADESLRGAAEAARLGWLATLRDAPRRADDAPEPVRPVAKSADATAAPDTPAAPARPSGSLTIERPIRSGQQIYARGADLVVIGPVSPGAEVIADGNVHVYGALQGRAIAGASGRRDVGIFTLDLRAELVAVSGIYRTFEDGVPAEHRGRPVRVELGAVADTLTVRPL